MPRIGRACAAGLAAALLVAGAGRSEAALLAGMFQDHAVLQQGRPIPVWGHAAAGDTVQVAIGGHQARGVADAQGRWRLDLPPMAAGGPYRLSVHAGGGRSQVVDDVMVGEVWLCAGQSNMQLPLRYGSNAFDDAVQHAADPGVRLLQIARADSRTPLEDLPRPQPWRTVSPATVADFSAACFYMGRELSKALKVPIGLIDASWGGSAIESWLSPGELRKAGYGERLDMLELSVRDPAAGDRRWGEAYAAWWTARHPGQPEEAPWRPDAMGEWRTAPQGLGYWEGWGLPELADFDGLVWHRTTIELTAAQAARPAVLHLGPVDDVDTTWVNGEVVGTTADASLPRDYRLRPGVLHAGTNSIVVAAVDSWGTGGLYGSPQDRALELGGERLSLDRPWSYRIEPNAGGKPPRAPWDALFGVTAIRNGMVVPMGPYAVRGAAWYQGESNVEAAGRYAGLLSGLMDDLRQVQGPDMPFLAVQLPGFGPHAARPVRSDWAELREAQRRAVAADPHAGLVVTIDIGDPYDVHPAEKQEVGRRLARAALAVAYGRPVSPSGPEPATARLQDGQVVVSFARVTGRLVTFSTDRPIGFELCGEGQASCVFAAGKADKDQVRLEVPAGLSPRRVRFCWADSPVCNLYDESGLPAGPSELEVR